MKTVNLIQGSKEWHDHRDNHDNASDASAVMGDSPHITRCAFLKMIATQDKTEIGTYLQKIFDDGHRYEALARPLAEKIIGEALYPIVGVEDDGRKSASFDGMTMNFIDDVIFEHKSLNDKIRAATRAEDLPIYLRIQMEQQLDISEAVKCLFMASKWTDDGTLIEEVHYWYYPDLELRKQIISAWAQFHADLLEYAPTAEVVKPVADKVTTLPAVSVKVSGEIIVVNNFEAFGIALNEFLTKHLIRTPETDQDFANLEIQIKTLKKAEEALIIAETNLLSQVSEISTAKQAKDALYDLARTNRLMAEKLLKAEKTNIRNKILSTANSEFSAYVQKIDVSIGGNYLPNVDANVAVAIKGKRTVDSLRSAANDAVAKAKIQVNEIAETIRANIKTLEEHDQGLKFLFNDLMQIITKAPDDFVIIVKHRVSEHQKAEEERIEAERKRIRKEEEAKALAKAEREEKAKQEALDRIKREQQEVQTSAALRAVEQASVQQEPEQQEPKESPAAEYNLSEHRSNKCKAKCDGNHSAPRCSDSGCWSDGKTAAANPELVVEKKPDTSTRSPNIIQYSDTPEKQISNYLFENAMVNQKQAELIASMIVNGRVPGVMACRTDSL